MTSRTRKGERKRDAVRPLTLSLGPGRTARAAIAAVLQLADRPAPGWQFVFGSLVMVAIAALPFLALGLVLASWR